jgi:hypothetical protein
MVSRWQNVPTHNNTITTILQRKCACGQHASASGECAECHRKRQSLQRHALNRVEVTTVPSSVGEVLRSSGRPLGPATRAFMEPLFGHDFSRVRIHTDAQAAESARALNALAYTVGRDVVFGAEQYKPQARAARRLLAHELAHVVQQQGRSGWSQPRLQVGSTNDAYERQADNIADRSAHASFAQPCAGTPRRSTTGSMLPVPELTQDVQLSPIAAAAKAEPHARVATSPLCYAQSGLMMPQLLHVPVPQLQRQVGPLDEGEETFQTSQLEIGGETLPYREAMEVTERGLYNEYVRDCAGIRRTLKRLERRSLSPLERVRRFERRVRGLPRVFELKRTLEERIREDPSNPKHRRDYQENYRALVEREFGAGYVLSYEDVELARARCELSKARWEFFAFRRHGTIPGRRLRRR